VVLAKQFRGIARLELGDAGGLGDLRAALDMGLERGFGLQTTHAYTNLGDGIWLCEGPEAALEVHRSGIEFGRRRGAAYEVHWLKMEALWMLFDLGRWDELLDEAAPLLGWAERHHDPQIACVVDTYRARVEVERGGASQTAERARSALAAAREIEDPQVLVPALMTSALAEKALGRGGGARALVDDFASVTADQPAWRLHGAAEMVRVLVTDGEPERAGALLDGLQPRLRRQELAFLSARACLAEAAGEADVHSLYREAAEGWAAYGHRLEQGLALLGAARTAPTSDAADAARRDANEIGRALGARRLLEGAVPARAA
jgi:hypothetical protein